MRRCPTPHQNGFTLIETLVALALIVIAVAALAQLFLQSTSLMLDARRAPVALAAAQSKIEQLRALPFTFDAIGAAVTDASSDTSLDPPFPTGGTGLQPSPSDSLERDVDGFIDHLDAYGRSLGGGIAIRPGALYTRRWSIVLAGGDADLLAIRSCVWKVAARHGPAAACVATVRGRRP